VYSSKGLKAKKFKIKTGVTIGPERRRSRKCRAKELLIVIIIIIIVVVVVVVVVVVLSCKVQNG